MGRVTTSGRTTVPTSRGSPTRRRTL
jgi:hypothetical protein